MKKFEVGKKYFAYSIVNSETKFKYEVVKRTEKTVTIKDIFGDIKRRKLYFDGEKEYFYPQGQYSMCPIVDSTQELKEEIQEKVQHIEQNEAETQYIVEETEQAAEETQHIDEKEVETQHIVDSNVISVDFQQQKYKIDEDMAEKAKRAMSFNDYKKGSATQEYRNMMNKAIEIAENQKSRVDSIYHKKIDYYLNLYARKLAENLNKYNEICTRCPSVMIVGRANFPVKKKEKQLQAWSRNAQEYQEIQEILYKIQGVGMGGISSDDPQAMKKLKQKLSDLEQKQEHMKQVNAYYKKNGTLEGCTLLSQHDIEELNSFMNSGQKPYTSPYQCFELSNNNANIRRIRKRIAELEKNDTLKGWTFESGKIIANKKLNRLQIIFEERPDEEIRTKLKKSGFRWSPSQKAWQRQLNRNAIYAAKRMEELKEVQKV